MGYMATDTNKQKQRKIAIIKLRFHLITSIITLTLILFGMFFKKVKKDTPAVDPIKKQEKVARSKIK